MAPAMKFKTYSRKKVPYRRNSSVEVFDALLAENIYKRKEASQLIKGRGTKTSIQIKDLPPPDENHHLMEDSVNRTLHIGMDDTFERLRKAPVYNNVNFKSTFMEVNDQSKSNSDNSNAAHSSIVRDCKNLADSSCEISKDSFKQISSQEKTLDKSVNISLCIEEVPTFDKPKDITLLSNASDSTTSHLIHNTNTNCDTDTFNEPLLSKNFKEPIGYRIHVASTPAIFSSTPQKLSLLIDETMSPILNFSPPRSLIESYAEIKKWDLKPPDFEISSPVCRDPNRRRKKQLFTKKIQNGQINKNITNNIKKAVTNIFSQKDIKDNTSNYNADSDWKLKAQPKIVLDKSVEVIGIQNSIKLLVRNEPNVGFRSPEVEKKLLQKKFIITHAYEEVLNKIYSQHKKTECDRMNKNSSRKYMNLRKRKVVIHTTHSKSKSKSDLELRLSGENVNINSVDNESVNVNNSKNLEERSTSFDKTENYGVQRNETDRMDESNVLESTQEESNEVSRSPDVIPSTPTSEHNSKTKFKDEMLSSFDSINKERLQHILSVTEISSNTACLEQTQNKSSFHSSNEHTSLEDTKDIQYSLQNNCTTHEFKTTSNVSQFDNENLLNEDNTFQNTKSIDRYRSCPEHRFEENNADRLFYNQSELEMHNHSSISDHNYSNTKGTNLNELSDLKDTVDINLSNSVNSLDLEGNTISDKTAKISALHSSEKIKNKNLPDKKLVYDFNSVEDIYNLTKGKKDNSFSQVQDNLVFEDAARKGNNNSNTEINNLSKTSESSSHKCDKNLSQIIDTSDNRIYFNNSQIESSISDISYSDLENPILITSGSDSEDALENSEEHQNDTCNSSFMLLKVSDDSATVEIHSSDEEVKLDFQNYDNNSQHVLEEYKNKPNLSACSSLDSRIDYDSDVHFDSDSSIESVIIENDVPKKMPNKDIGQSVKHDLILKKENIFEEPNNDTMDESIQCKNHTLLIEETDDTIDPSVQDIALEIEISEEPNDTTVNTLKRQDLAVIREEEPSISFNESFVPSYEIKDLKPLKGLSLKPGKSWRRSLLFSRKFSLLLESDTCIANKGKSFLATYLSKFLSNT
ncbi:hypothetical protein ILUMI_07287 [Ignelater luminosus]|uniref:Uncharacterized protein n=1 Tax=Ignelater luminosus TaxID=2038154 RepID=A0A8K0GI73_IGNLU|nr:hypothetical protein ILUMI_07287 [Ignelater luminosus]